MNSHLDLNTNPDTQLSHTFFYDTAQKHTDVFPSLQSTLLLQQDAVSFLHICCWSRCQRPRNRKKTDRELTDILPHTPRIRDKTRREIMAIG